MQSAHVHRPHTSTYPGRTPWTHNAPDDVGPIPKEGPSLRTKATISYALQYDRFTKGYSYEMALFLTRALTTRPHYTHDTSAAVFTPIIDMSPHCQ